jgi:hypothetical protein
MQRRAPQILLMWPRPCKWFWASSAWSTAEMTRPNVLGELPLIAVNIRQAAGAD